MPKIDGNTIAIKRVSYFQKLGVTIDNGLKWTNYLSYSNFRL